MREPMLLWVTRTAPFNLRTRRNLRALGHRAVTVPTLHVASVPHALPPDPPDAIAFTSGHALRLHDPREDLRKVPVFAVGDNTAALARAIGYEDVRSADGDVHDLLALIRESLPVGRRVLHLCSREPAGDLAGALAAANYRAERLVVYESRPASISELRAVADTIRFIDGIIVHSPRGAEAAARLAAATDWRGTVFCLSEACGARFQTMPGISIEVADAPNEDALLQRIEAYRPIRLSRSLQARSSGRILPLRLVVSNDRPLAAVPATGGSDEPPPTAA